MRRRTMHWLRVRVACVGLAPARPAIVANGAGSFGPPKTVAEHWRDFESFFPVRVRRVPRPTLDVDGVVGTISRVFAGVDFGGRDADETAIVVTNGKRIERIEMKPRSLGASLSSVTEGDA